ncbi:unnamed protein product [Symbiodinium natans]|uniref:Uncharacterized protein n=1 Tax=Symbiodinium natans TaxID=878477 RepID=A0A812S3Y6_9DINO|nr:unnamed protein product [Symbiodinium natans]
MCDDEKNGCKQSKQGKQSKQSADASSARAWTCKKEIAEIYSPVVDDQQFELIEEGVSLDPHDQDNSYMYTSFRSKDGGRLTREIVDRDFVLVGDDKCGLSAVLNVPVPPGATLSVQMTTWCNPCHSGFGVTKSGCFGVGMVPYGCAEVQEWPCDDFQTCIEDGVQYYCELAWSTMLSGIGGARLEGMLASGSVNSMIQHTLDVVQGGTSIHHSKQTQLSLEMIHIRLRRDASGESELSFAHGTDVFKVKRPGKDAHRHMQLYFNCLGWADNKTYIQIHKVAYDPPLCDRKASESDKDSKKRASEEDLPDYAKILKADPELRKQVDELIKSKQQ